MFASTRVKFKTRTPKTVDRGNPCQAKTEPQKSNTFDLHENFAFSELAVWRLSDHRWKSCLRVKENLLHSPHHST
jgi:hypothetical protein